MSKVISSAVLFTDKNKFLAVHPTGSIGNHWDLPKGRIDDGENPIDTAVREFKEETGISLDKSKLKHIGKFPLHNEKDIILFLYIIDELPSLSSLKCTSTTTKAFKSKKVVPEVDEYHYFKLTEFTKMRVGLYRAILNTVLKMKESMEE